MIDYQQLDRFYTGISMPVIMNAGGMLLELGEDTPSLFYKLDDEHFADVNRKGVIAQVLKKGSIITSHYVLQEESIQPVRNRKEIVKSSRMVKRLQFNPSNYNI